MSVNVLFDRVANRSVLYCNTDDRPFGPVFTGNEATDFLEWIEEKDRDPRDMNNNTLDVWVNTWQAEVEAAADSYDGPTDVERYGAGAR